MVLRLGIDLMGGDHSPESVLKAIIAILKQHGNILLNCECLLVPIISECSEKSCKEVCSQEGISWKDLNPFIAENFVEMEDSPLFALRRKRNSTIAIGVNLLKDGFLDGLVSTGNTGALFAFACHQLPLIQFIERPALLVRLPTLKGSVIVLDVGANVSVKPNDVLMFAQMGRAYKLCLDASQLPKIGLLNIGREEKKGTESHRQTFSLLQENFGSNFLGNIESGDVFRGKVDVVVTDGFTGNIFLKTAEGVADCFSEIFFRNEQNFISPNHHNKVSESLDLSIYQGSFLCGLSKLVVKCHGFSDHNALINGILNTINLANQNICSKMELYLNS